MPFTYYLPIRPVIPLRPRSQIFSGHGRHNPLPQGVIFYGHLCSIIFCNTDLFVLDSPYHHRSDEAPLMVSEAYLKINAFFSIQQPQYRFQQKILGLSPDRNTKVHLAIHHEL